MHNIQFGIRLTQIQCVEFVSKREAQIYEVHVMRFGVYF